MSTFILVAGLVLLFALLGTSADIAIANIRVLGQRLRISPFSLGLMLGMLTTLPELFVGLNAVLAGVAPISFGNLMGGIIVLLGLVAGLSVLANRTIRTPHLFQTNWIVLMGGMMILPMFLAADKNISVLEGLLLAVLYILIINGMLANPKIQQDDGFSRADEIRHDLTTRRAIVFSLIGIIGVVIFSHFTIQIAVELARALAMPLLFTGLIIFSIGTNLPELTVAFTAWRAGIKRLALGNVVGSAFTNSLVVGVLAAFKPFEIKTSPSFWITFAILLVLVFLYIYFGISGHKFTRREGVVLLSLYFLFLASEIIWLLA